jgi:hypothetical protein
MGRMSDGLTAACVADCGDYEVYDIIDCGKWISRVELLKPRGPGCHRFFVRRLPGGAAEIGWELSGDTTAR